METAFGWLGSIFEFLFSWFPHLITIDANEIGVKFPRGKKTKVLLPGLHWFWPLVTNEPEKVSCAMGPTECDEQSLTSKDGWPVRLQLIVVSRVMQTEQGVILAMVKTDDIDDAIEELALEAVAPLVGGWTFDEAKEAVSSGEFQRTLTERIAEPMAERHGIEVLRAYPMSFTRYIPIGEP